MTYTVWMQDGSGGPEAIEAESPGDAASKFGQAAYINFGLDNMEVYVSLDQTVWNYMIVIKVKISTHIQLISVNEGGVG